MADVEQRIAAVEARVESAFALDARLEAIEGDVRKLKSSSLRDWLQTLGPYVAGLIILVVGYWIKDSVTLARASFDRYLEHASGRAEPDAHGLAMVLKGNAILRGSGGSIRVSTPSEEIARQKEQAREVQSKLE